MQFYFKWKNDDISISNSELNIFAISIVQKEGEFAKANIKICNQENISSREYGEISAEFSGVRRTIFVGKVLSIPVSTEKDMMTIELISKPRDYRAKINKIISENFKTPFYNKLFPSPDGDTEPIEARSAFYYVDKVSGDITLSDVVGDQNTPNKVVNYFEDSLSVQYGTEPVDAVELLIQVDWVSEYSEILDLYNNIANKCKYTLSGDDFIHKFNIIVNKISNDPNYIILSNSVREIAKENISKTIGPYVASMKKSVIDGELLVKAFVDIKRQETFRVLIHNNHKGSSSGKIKKIGFNLGTISNTEEIDSLDSFFMTKAGREAVDHGLKRAKAYIKFSTRMVYVTFSGTLEDLADITTNNTVTLKHKLFGNTNITGKVIKTELSVDSQKKYVRITLGVSLGNNDKDQDIISENLKFKHSYVDNNKATNFFIDHTNVFNTGEEQVSKLLDEEFDSVEAFEEKAKNLYTDIFLKFKTRNSIPVKESLVTADDITFSVYKGM